MSQPEIAAALQRAESVLRRRPAAGREEDSPATARWQGGLRATAVHAGGAEVTTDMPTALGGLGDQPSPGWLLRAALASCAVTRVAMQAAREGIELTRLEARVTSVSDARGLLGMIEDDGGDISAGPGDVRLHLEIAANGATEAQLRSLAACAMQSPVARALTAALPIALHVEIGAA